MKKAKSGILVGIASKSAPSILSILLIMAIVTFNATAQEYIAYQIEEGDCLWTIARQFQLSIQEIAEANNINQNEILSPGLSIKIPQDQSNHSGQDNNAPTVIHTVQRGESLWDIAQQYRLSLDCISSINHLKEPDSLSIGQKIRIPTDDSNVFMKEKESSLEEEQPDLSFESDRLNPLGMANSLNQQFRDSVQEIDYTVKPGESLWTIAQNYQVSLKELTNMNDLENEEKLSIGQIIKIPLGGRTANDVKKVNNDNGNDLQETWVEHIVEYGENISMIAQKYHISIQTLCQLNQISEKDYVYPGQRLKITASSQEGNNFLSEEEDNNARQTLEQNEMDTPSRQDNQPVYYTVKSGDTLWSIAQNYSVSMESILAVNYLSNKDLLSVGQKLEIPAMGGPNKADVKIKTINYTVVKGDSLWNIARKFDVAMYEIININDLENITKLSIGQKLKIPSNGQLAAEQSSGTTNQVAQTEKPKDIIHYVQKGETLWQISRRYQVTLQSITSANRISESDRIVVGQKLVVPNVRSSSLSSRSFIWPLNGLITSHFGIRTLGRRRDYHTGIDIDGHTGTPIRAAESGKVSFSGYINGYGNIVIVDHAGGYSTVYAHNSSNLVRKGQNVTKGEIIARLGATGNSTGSHLHFEIRQNGKPVNPLNYLP